MTQATLLDTAGVLVRANTAHGVNIRLIELATSHGWKNDFCGNADLVAAGHGRTVPSPDMEEQLVRGGRAAFDWLTAFAVPDGMELVELDDRVVLYPEGQAP
jgi:hypothetical protein